MFDITSALFLRHSREDKHSPTNYPKVYVILLDAG
jgi:hypothetical protein